MKFQSTHNHRDTREAGVSVGETGFSSSNGSKSIGKKYYMNHSINQTINATFYTQPAKLTSSQTGNYTKF